MAWLTVLQFAFIVFIVIYLTVNMLDLVRLETVRGPLKNMPKVSVCVPARNEERSLSACLTSLLNQDYPEYEVIVVDDNSTDDTSKIIQGLANRYPRLIPVSAPALPEGWYGKPHALFHAVKRATGEILLFTDADPVFEPFALTSAVHAMEVRKVDLLTLMPKAIFGSFWERAIQPVMFGFIAAKTRHREVNDPNSKKAMGFGAFTMIRKTVYDRIGGHEKLRQKILDDIGLARLAKSEGARCLVADGKFLLSIRMYHSLSEIWIGWRKNAFLAFRKSVPRTFFFIAMILGFLLTPYLLVLANGFVGTHWLWQGISWIGLILVWMSGIGICDAMGLKRRDQFLFPLGALMASAVIINSMTYILWRNQSEWRGRIYSKPN